MEVWHAEASGEVGMAAGQADDRVLPLARVTMAVVAPILIAAGVMLYAFPGETEALWAWPMGPEMTALAVGGGYLAGAVLFVRALRATEWHRVAMVFPVATVLTVLLLVATLLHWDSFSHGHPSFWAWLVVYLITPVLLPVVWLANRGRDPGVPAPTTPLVPRWVCTLVGLAGVAQLVVALAFFVVTDLAEQVWPWAVSPLTARTLAAFLAFIGAMWLAFLLERRWSALRLHVESATIGLGLVALGALRATEDLDRGAGATAVFAALLGGTLVGLVVLQVGMRRMAKQAVGT
jgi:hypothetical protein